jgi:metallo-beta-lactamase family protein
VSKKNIQIRFVGSNSHEVTGSCIWIKTPHRQILLECGLYQSAGNTLDVYNVNNAPFEFKAKEIDYVFVNHTHIDHCGRLPLLYKRGAHAKTCIPFKNTTITEILLRDSAKVASADAAELSKKFGRDYAPLYDNDDVSNTMNYVEEFNFNEMVVLDEYVKFRFVPSGHIFGAAQLELWVTEGLHTEKILYTSDLGNVHIKKPFVEDFQPVEKANIVIGESTYGDEEAIARQKMRDKDMEKIAHAVEEVCKEGRGKILIPVFANSRAQEILTMLYKLYGNDPSFRIPILFDTPMGLSVCAAYTSLLEGEDKRLWDKVMNWHMVKFISEAAESKAWQSSKGPAIVLATSGMMTHGRSRAWCRALLPNRNNMILFCGFAIENSLASIIKAGKMKKIKLSGEWVANRCKILSLRSFSSHMQHDSLVKYYSSIQCERIYLVHGDKPAKDMLCTDVAEALAKNDNTAKVVAVQKNFEITL